MNNNRTGRKQTLPFWLLLTFTACATTGPLYQPAVVPNNDQALIYVYRPSKWMAKLNKPMISVNGKEIGRLASGTYVPIYVSSGAVTIRSHWFRLIGYGKGETINMVANPGSTYYMRVVYSVSGGEAFLGGGLIFGPAMVDERKPLELIDEPMAEKEIENLRLRPLQ